MPPPPLVLALILALARLPLQRARRPWCLNCTLLPPPLSPPLPLPPPLPCSGIPRDVPLAVQQWQGLIAVNYAARAAGVKRHMRVPEALRACPGLRLVHVETLGEEGAAVDPASPNKATQKASLRRYRDASKAVMDIINRMVRAGLGGRRRLTTLRSSLCVLWAPCLLAPPLRFSSGPS